MTIDIRHISLPSIFALSIILGASPAHSAPNATKQIDLQAVAGSSEIKRTWTLSNIVPSAQEIYRDTDPNPRGRVRIGYTRNRSEYSDTIATAGQTHDY